MKRRNYLRIGVIVVLLVLILVFQYALNHSESFLIFYIRHLFLPLQRGRSNLFNGISISVGDTLYLLLALLLLLVLIRTVYFLFTFKRNKNDLLTESLRLGMLPLIIYFLFLLLWGGNYSRKPLSAEWNLETLQWDTHALIDLNETLVRQMNAVQQHPISYTTLELTNTLANRLYHQRFGDKLPHLKVKPTSLGYMLNYLGIQGYYNPLSGEGQFNRFIPPFMHPFVVSHEMAHQAGIAAEDDANLLAYVLASESTIPAFRYSAYFNLFLYAYSDLQVRDSTAARQIFAGLNQQSRNDMDTLRAMNRRYRSRFRRISTSLYDEYLRLHGQTEGINTYSDVSRWVYFREHAREKGADLNVCP
ncbi:DUF3810 family protein [Taibaiella helva]|uniref:DUF3810 family protein n=1 Tax=Taibaiella helva TaxID=2301235 RepID=UPI000E57C10F|nr:DUF3810 family protein [Taibaiella helva]